MSKLLSGLLIQTSNASCIYIKCYRAWCCYSKIAFLGSTTWLLFMWVYYSMRLASCLDKATICYFCWGQPYILARLDRYNYFLRIFCTDVWPPCGFWGESCDTPTYYTAVVTGWKAPKWVARQTQGHWYKWINFACVAFTKLKWVHYVLHFRSSLRFAY